MEAGPAGVRVGAGAGAAEMRVVFSLFCLVPLRRAARIPSRRDASARSSFIFPHLSRFAHDLHGGQVNEMTLLFLICFATGGILYASPAIRDYSLA